MKIILLSVLFYGALFAVVSMPTVAHAVVDLQQPSHLLPSNAATSFKPLVSSGQGSILGNLYGTGSGSIGNFLNALFTFAISIGALASVFQLVYAGYLFMLHGTELGSRDHAKDIIANVFLGLTVLLGVTLILGQINPNLLNLDVLHSVPQTAQTQPAATQTVQTTQQTSQTVTQRNTNNLGASVAQLQDQCRAKGGTPITNDNGVAGSVTVTCNMTPAVTAGQTITQTQCLNLPTGAGQVETGVDCTNSGVQALVQQGGYTCNPLSGGGVCLHK